MTARQPVVLVYKNEEFTIQPDKLMPLLEQVENIITLEELTLNEKGLKRAAISRAFTVALNYAGAKVTQEEIYESMFTGEAAISTANAVTALLSLLIPPQVLAEKMPKKPEADKKKRGG